MASLTAFALLCYVALGLLARFEDGPRDPRQRVIRAAPAAASHHERAA